MSGILRLGQGVRDPEGTGKLGVRDPEGTGKVSGILKVRARCQGS